MNTKAMKKDIQRMSFFSYICLWQVILLRSYIRLRRVILCFAQVKGKYNITETKGFNITFDLSKITLQRSWNSTKTPASIMNVKARKREHKNNINQITF